MTSGTTHGQTPPAPRRRIAVVGAGVAGLTAAYVMQRDADVTLYESDARLGGHAHTHELLDDLGERVNVDSGFIVHNRSTYPHLIRLFDELDVPTQESEMSMSISCGGCGLEYAGSLGLGGLFPTGANARNPRFVYMLTEVLRFNRRARALLATDLPGQHAAVTANAGSHAGETMDDFLDRGRFSRYFRAHFVTPLISAVWSCAPELAGQYPARYLFEFLANHGMLTVTGSPSWRTVVGGSGRYVEKAVKNLSAVQLSTPVRGISRVGDGIEIRDDSDQVARYDAVVIATHPAQALRLLTEPSAAEADALGAIEYSVNPTVLHTDTAVLPQAAKAHASWNYRLPDCAASASAVNVSYDMNRLQRLSTDTHYLVTLNDDGLIDADKVVDRMTYEHPIFTPASVAAQSRLPALNDGTVAFAGAYHGWGFHEDGCRSGVEAARSLGIDW